MSKKDPLLYLKELLQATPPPEVAALAREFVEVERAKLDLKAKAIHVFDEQDRRRAEFHMRRLQLKDEADRSPSLKTCLEC